MVLPENCVKTYANFLFKYHYYSLFNPSRLCLRWPPNKNHTSFRWSSLEHYSLFSDSLPGSMARWFLILKLHANWKATCSRFWSLLLSFLLISSWAFLPRSCWGGPGIRKGWPLDYWSCRSVHFFLYPQPIPGSLTCFWLDYSLLVQDWPCFKLLPILMLPLLGRSKVPPCGSASWGSVTKEPALSQVLFSDTSRWKILTGLRKTCRRWVRPTRIRHWPSWRNG